MWHRFTAPLVRGLLHLAVFAQLLALHSPVRAAEPSLRRDLDAIVQSATALGATTAVEVVSVPTGEVLYSRNARVPLIPASNMKLISGAVALDCLEPETVFATTLSAAAPPDANGTIPGPIVLAGTGDPTLYTEDLIEIATQLRALGVRRVAGDLIVDSECIADRGMGEGWLLRDENRSFAAQISGICLNWNCVEIIVSPGYGPGAPALVDLDPVTAYVQIEVPATTVAPGQGTRLVIYRNTGGNKFVVKGTIALEHEPVTIRRTVHEPDLYVGQVLREVLPAVGVVVEGDVRRGRLPRDATVLAFHHSASIRRLFTAMMKYSANLTCEQLYRVASYIREGQGSEKASERMARSLLEAADAELSGLQFADASGLSRGNRLTARAITDLLRYMWLTSPHADLFFDSLPVAGVDGTLRKRMVGTAAENNLRGKTGTLRGASSLSGYVITRDGEPVCFAIIMNGFNGGATPIRRIQDRIGARLAEVRR